MVTRRQILKTAAATGMLTAFAPASAAFAAVPSDRRLVVVILRGGADSLALVPPTGDAAYASLRAPLLKQDKNGAPLPLDGFFSLHPKFSGLESMWRDKELAIIHGAQTGYRERSHFDAQDLLENGLDKVSGLADGWLNRALGYFGAAEPTVGLAAGYGMPLILKGKTPVSTWAPRRLPRPDAGYLAKLVAISGSDANIGHALADGIKAEQANRALLGDLEMSRSQPNSKRGIADLAAATGKLLSSDQGARIAAFDISGWDTHGYQNTSLGYRVPVLDGALVALKSGLGAAWKKSIVVVVSEFGRTAVPNGTGGTDHGTAGAMLLLGGAVRGGRVLSDWPGLAQNNLYQGRDLKPTMDVRSVFKGLLVEHLGIDAAFVEARVFPNSRPARLLENLSVV